LNIQSRRSTKGQQPDIATLSSAAIKFVIAASIMLGILSFLTGNTHAPHVHESIDLAISAPAHEAGAETGPGKAMSIGESIHGHSHDGFSHDHVVEVLGEDLTEFRNSPLSIRPDDLVSSIYTRPVFEIYIPPRVWRAAALATAGRPA